VSETPPRWLSRSEIEQAVLEEIKARLEAGEIPARPGRYEVTVCEEVQG
jgi:hypothetical protein